MAASISRSLSSVAGIDIKNPFELQTEEERSSVVKKIIEICNANLRNQGVFNAKKTSLGATGITYICNLKREAIKKGGIDEEQLPRYMRVPGKEVQEDLTFLLKYLNNETGRNERYCAELLKKFDLTTPDILISEAPEDSISEYKFMEKLHGSSLGDNGKLIFMYAFPGCTFQDLLKSGAIKQLKKEDFENLLMEIGKVSVFDLLIANDDRFFQYDRSSFGALKPFVNPGNLMFNLTVSKDGKRKLNATYCIDNATTPKLAPPKPKSEVDDDSAGPSLFGDDEDDDDWGSENEEEAAPLPVTGMTIRDFSLAFQYYLDERHHEEFAEIIYDGILEQLEQYKENLRTGDLPILNPDEIKLAVVTGIKRGYQDLREKTADLDKFINEIKEIPGSEFNYCKTTIDVVKSNLEKLLY